MSSRFNIKERLVQMTWYQKMVERAKRTALPGFGKMSLYEVSRFFLQSIQRGAITMRASSLAFKFFLALFPAMIVLFSLISEIPISNFEDLLREQIQVIMPDVGYDELLKTMEEMKSKSALSLGLIMTIYFATNGISAMIDAFNQSHLSTGSRSFIMQRLVSLLLLVLLTLIVITSVILIIFGNMIIQFLIDLDILHQGLTLLLLQLSRFLITIALFYFSISFIYYIGPYAATKWRFFSAGSTVATALTILVSLGFAYFVNEIGNYDKIYGSISSMIVLMLWIYFNSIILLVGFELNASIAAAQSVQSNKTHE